jgi:hypothetical protein
VKVDRELHLASAVAMDSNEKFPACPFCDSAAAVRPSRRLPNTRALLSLVFVQPFRCTDCGYGFWRIRRQSSKSLFAEWLQAREATKWFADAKVLFGRK